MDNVKVMDIYIKAPNDLRAVLEHYPFISFLNLDCQGGEDTALRSSTVLRLLELKVQRVLVATHRLQYHVNLEQLFTSLGWIKTIDYQRNPDIMGCDATLSQESQEFWVKKQCLTDTEWGPVYVRDGLLGKY